MNKRRRKKEKVGKPVRDMKSWPPLDYTHTCSCGHVYSDGYPMSKCPNCTREVLAGGLFQRSGEQS